MTETEIQFKKKREIGDVLSDSFRFLKQEIKPLSKLFGVYIFPFIIAYGILQIYVQRKIMGRIDMNDPDMIISNIGPIYQNIFFVALFGIFVHSLFAGTYYTFIEHYVKRGKGNFELSEITPLFFKNGLQALGANLLLFTLVMAGTVMFIVPGIYFLNTFSLVVMILIFEKKGIGNAFSRSWALVNYLWWNTFLVNIVGVIIVYAIGIVISIPSMIAGVSTSLFKIQQTQNLADYPDWYWIMMGATTIISAVFWIIPYTIMAFQYFNLDERTKPAPPKHEALEE